MTDETDDYLEQRLEGRFDDSDSSGNSTNGGRERTETNSKKEKKAKNAMLAQNVKEEWTATSVYLPEFLDRRLKTQYKRLDLEFEEQVGTSLPKTRHYYPAVVALGLERMEGMDPHEIDEVIERLEQEGAEE